ncbi:MAG: transglycosylase SLT domain-containing protein [Myxococcota bacterium]
MTARPERFLLGALAALALASLAACEACSTTEATRETSNAAAPDAGAASADARTANTGDAVGAPGDAARAAAEEPLRPIDATPSADQAPPDLDTLGRYFDAPPLSGAVLMWHSGQRAAASQALDAFALAHPEDPRALPARFLSAWVLSDGEPDPTVARRFQALAADWPLFADACDDSAARALAADVELDQAVATLGKIPASSIHWGPAQALVAQALENENRAADARKVLEAAVTAQPDVLPAEAWERLESLRAAAGDAAGAAAARLQLATRFPGDDRGKAALSRLELGQVAAAARVKLGAALLDAGRADATRAVLSGLSSPKPEACQAWILLGRAWERKKKDEAAADSAFKWYKRALDCEGDPRGDATFLGGRNRMRHSDAKQGLKLLKQHVAEFPKRSTADDALQMIANASKRPADVDKGLVKALTRYPGGDMADDIAWDLVSKPIIKRKWKEAKVALDKVLAATDGQPSSRHAGRYRYWKARALWELGKKDDARALWRELVADNAFSWYSLLAYSRLAAEDAPAAEKLLREHAPAPASAAAPDAHPRPKLWADDHFRRAVEWARLAGPANPPDGPSPFHAFVDAELAAVSEPLRGDDWTWTSMTVLELAGNYPRAVRLGRLAENAGALGWPADPQAAATNADATKADPAKADPAKGAVARAWRLAYPRPFPELVAQWAEARKIDPFWIWSIARVESNFDPSAVSWANAIGLMQIIPSTAKFLAKDTTIDPTRDALLRPDVALELGTKYLARLLAKHGLYPLASASYNAGGGAVSRWRNDFGDVDLDEFVERIPYREANNYAKSVTQTLARYAWLYEGRIVTLDLAAPGVPKDPAPTEDPAPADPAPDAAAPDAAPDAPAADAPPGPLPEGPPAPPLVVPATEKSAPK